jgi:hypothetical protein
VIVGNWPDVIYLFQPFSQPESNVWPMLKERQKKSGQVV